MSFTLLDNNGDVVAQSSPGATNYTAGLNNFVSPDDETYYVQVTGDPGAQFNLVVTRGADFITEPNADSPVPGQDITATERRRTTCWAACWAMWNSPSISMFST